MNELFLYDLFKEILRHSTVMEGRFVVVKSGADINEPNHGQIVRDALDGLKEGRKYPAAVLLPPFETVESYDRGWSGFRLIMYFLTKDSTTGTNELKGADYDALISNHPVSFDWKDMRECAGNFRVALNKVLRQPAVLRRARERSNRPDAYDRISWAGDDKLNGVRLTFDLELFMPCELADYPESLLTDIAMPSLNSHPLHKH